MSGHVHDRKILRVSWTPKKTNEWKLSDTAKARKLAYYGEETRGGRDNARNNARCTQARKATHGLDGQQDVYRTPHGTISQNDRDKWRKYVHGVANPRIEDG